jgi:lipid-A-disaccharide synthase
LSAPPASSQSPRLSVAAELARSCFDVAALPWRAWRYRGEHDERVRELLELLEHPAEVEDLPAPRVERELSLFVSCAEVSGEIHAVNLVRALRTELAAGGAPPARFFGLGGRALAAEGVELVGDPVSRATMGFDVLHALPFYLRLVTHGLGELAARRADAAVLVDSPALHAPLGRLARGRGTRVVHFVTPQYWGWAPWRVERYRSAVDLSLSILPFEKAWFDRRGVRCRHVGHPLLDALPARVPAPDAPERRTLALLAGSRESVLQRNLPWMLGVASELCRDDPELRIVVPHERTELGDQIDGLVRAARAAHPELAHRVAVELGDLHGSLGRARTAFAVSGTALLDLLHHRLPTVVVYRLARARELWMAKRFLTAPYFASPNLLAAREVAPEFCFVGDGPRGAVRDALRRAHGDSAWRAGCLAGLELARARLGPAGACARAARAVLWTALGRPLGPEDRRA